jgi:hypothetical protein
MAQVLSSKDPTTKIKVTARNTCEVLGQLENHKNNHLVGCGLPFSFYIWGVVRQKWKYIIFYNFFCKHLPRTKKELIRP